MRRDHRYLLNDVPKLSQSLFLRITFPLESTDFCTYLRWHQTASYSEWFAQNGQVKTKFPLMNFVVAKKAIVSGSDYRCIAFTPKAFIYLTDYWRRKKKWMITSLYSQKWRNEWKKYFQSHLLGKQINSLPVMQPDIEETSAPKSNLLFLSIIALWDWLSLSANKQGVKSNCNCHAIETFYGM